MIAFPTEPINWHSVYERTVIIEPDASDNISAADLPQYQDHGIFDPVAYFPYKHTPAKSNNDINDDEPMAIIKALEEWRPIRDGATYPLHLITNDKSLEYYMTKKLLNCRQVQSLDILTEFD